MPSQRPEPSAQAQTAVERLVRDRRPDRPLEVVFPQVIAATAETLVNGFPGRVLYAVKCNPSRAVLRALWEGGVRHFDAASIPEMAAVREACASAGIHFMHPVKARDDIAKACRQFGVTTFVVDSEDEFEKVLEEAGGDEGLDILLRLSLPSGSAGRDLSGKFGVPRSQAAAVLKRAWTRAGRVGLTFHVGSQCLDPQAFARAADTAKAVAAEAGLPVAILDVGGGLPVPYDGCACPSLGSVVEAVTAALKGWPGGALPELWCEPGRALAAAGTVLVARVVARRGDTLFLNDGIYGGLNHEAAAGWRYPAWLIPAHENGGGQSDKPFTLFGPTCDSHDRLPATYSLPADTAEGDWIAFGMAGAYAPALRTTFNGYGQFDTVIGRI